MARAVRFHLCDILEKAKLGTPRPERQLSGAEGEAVWGDSWGRGDCARVGNAAHCVYQNSRKRTLNGAHLNACAVTTFKKKNMEQDGPLRDAEEWGQCLRFMCIFCLSLLLLLLFLLR